MSESRGWITFYKVLNEFNEIMYIGASKFAKMDKLEESERNWKTKYGVEGESAFRRALSSQGRKWTFHRIVTDTDMTRKQADVIKGGFIRELKPQYNETQWPAYTAEKYGHYA